MKGMVALLCAFNLVHAQPSADATPSLAESFNAGAPEVEPVVVGREKWNEKPPASPEPEPTRSTSEDNNPTRINELDPLETPAGTAGPKPLTSRSPQKQTRHQHC